MSINTGHFRATTGSGPAELPFWPLLITLFLGSFAGMYHVVSLNVSLPGFIGIFDAELSTVQWIITGFSLACGMITPVSGYLVDRFGGRSMFLLSLAGITAGSILCALSWNIYALIGFRMVQGFFCGLIQPISLTMIYQTLPRERQPLAVSVWSFSTVLGTAIGPSLSGWFQQHDWRWIFLVTVPIGAAAWIAGLLLLPSGFTAVRKRLDVAGLVLATVGSLVLLLLFGNIHAWGLQSPLSWGCLIIGSLCVIMFVRVELRTREPLLNLRLFRNTAFTISLAVSLILTFALYSGVYFIPLFLEEIQGLSPFQVGLLFLPAAACLTIATFLSGRWYASWGPALLITLGSLILFVTTFRFSRLHMETTLITVMIWMCIRNVGSGLAISPATSAAMAAVTEQESGHASALLNWLRQVFSSISLGMFTSLFYARLNVHEGRLSNATLGETKEWLHRVIYTRSIDDVFLVASGLVALAIPLALLLRRRKQTLKAAGSSAMQEPSS